MTRGTVLVGVDGSDQSATALIWAADDAAGRDAALLVVYVVDTAFLGMWSSLRPVRQELRRVLQPIVDRAVEDAVAYRPGLSVRGRLLFGPTARTMLILARGCELTVVGRSGRGALGRLWLGTLPQRLIAWSTTPVAVVGSTAVPAPHGRPAAGTVRTVVVGVPSDAQPARLLDAAAGLAARRGAGLQLVQAIDLHARSSPLADLIPALTSRYPQLRCGSTVQVGGAGQVLADACRPGDLLVLGRHQRAALEPPRLGRTVTSALDRVDCDVLVVPDDAPPR